MRDGAPIRFLVVLLGGWTCVRVATIAPSWWPEEAVGTVATVTPAVASLPERPAAPVETFPPLVAESAPAFAPSSAPYMVRRREDPMPLQPRVPQPASASPMLAPSRAPMPTPPFAAPGAPVLAQTSTPPPLLVPSAQATVAHARRWSGSAWLLVRQESGTALAPGGTLGGSQAGARLLYRLNDDPSRPLALSARVYLPLRRTAGAEAALGLDWQPVRQLPVHLLAERRQRIGREGRSAFALTTYGGGSADLGYGFRIDGYAQAGLVGIRSRDGFVDGSARVVRPIGPVEVGGGVWGAAQPGASRVDAGPLLSMPLRVGGGALRLSAEYRFRIAGDARPTSGPALTLGVDF